ncbi:MAG: DUF4332 domain-containing protein [Lachnospiraceae bacterium]|nr:DUF4332 domain-containing protein [Lachnospiraceae bacterium]
MATSNILKPVYDSVTLTEGESFQIALDGEYAKLTNNLEWSSSDRDHVAVNKEGIVTCMKPGEATITIKEKIDGKVIKEAKVKLYVVQGTSFVSGMVHGILPLYVTTEVRQKLNTQCGITSLQNVLEKAVTKEQREDIAKKTGETAATVGVWFRQAALWQINGMTKEIAYLAALAGFRNVYDVARADFEQMKAIFRILVNSIKLPTQDTITVPDEDAILIVLNNAKKMEPEDCNYYYVVGADDPEPTFLLSKDAERIKTDTQILQEGLEFLNNIKMALPLPTTISGAVEMKSGKETPKIEPKCGLKVSISGIANPARDKSEGDEELYCYTGENGEFSIVMPDRYNMQETVKITVTENKNDTYSGTFKTVVEGATAVNQTTFVKRASEIIAAEYVDVPVEYDAKGKITKTERMSAVEILQSIDRILMLNNGILLLEQRLYEKATNQSQLTKDQLQAAKDAADQHLAECELAIKEELAYHYRLKDNEINNKQKRLEQLKKQKENELKGRVIAEHEGVFKQYLELREQLGYIDTRETFLGKEQEMFERFRKQTAEIIAKDVKPIRDNLIKEPTANNLIKEPIVFNPIVDPNVQPIINVIRTPELDAIEAELGRYRTFEDRIEEIIKDNCFVEVVDAEQGRGISLQGENDPNNHLIVYLPAEFWNVDTQIEALQKEIERLVKERDALAVSIELSEERYQALKREHEARHNENSDSLDLERIKELCHLTEEKVNAYLKAQNECLELKKQLEIATQNAAVYAEADAIQKYCDSMTEKNDQGEVTSYKDQDVEDYLNKKKERKGLEELIYSLDETTNEFRRTILNFLSRRFDADLGRLLLHKDTFESKEFKPRALPSVKLMGDGDDAVYLPTDTSPARMFRYAMMQRLVEPEIRMNNKTYTRQKMTDALDVMEFKKNMYENQGEIAVATSLGIGYMLNMHQAWVPDGYTLGNLLYSLVLAPGEEQRIIVREHKESYMVTDEATALDTVNDSYSNSQVDNETAAFTSGAERFSSAHTDSKYSSSSSSSGKAGIGVFFGIGAKSSASSSSSGSSSSNSYQSDSYDEVSNAAQNFQSSIQTEAARIATAKRASISIATSDETESLSSKIIANHNHSHVMTVQYWEVMRRYCLETCIEGVELALFVPMKLVNFMPNKNLTAYSKFSGFTLNVSDMNLFTKDNFNHRYRQLLEYADVLAPALPRKFAGGLELIRKFASYPEWKAEKRVGDPDKKVELTLKGRFMEFDELSAQLYFNNGSSSIAGEIESFSYYGIHPSMNTRNEVIYAMKQIRNGISVKKDQEKIGKHANVDVYTEAALTPLGGDGDKEIKFVFHLPASVSVNDISHVYVRNDLRNWEYHLSQNRDYMEDDEKVAIERYEKWKYNLNADNFASNFDKTMIAHYEEGLPECYLHPIAKFNKFELINIGGIDFKAELNIPGQIDGESTPACSSAKIGSGSVRIDVSNHIPVLGYNEIMEIENTFHHVASNTLRYSQTVWRSLTDNERIMLLEPYTVEFNNPTKLAEGNTLSGKKPIKDIPLLNCVNAKKLLGFYGNCMMLPFTYPQELAEILGKTAADIQDELYRYHTSNFRVPFTVVSVPTEGMVGEAVLGATNVSEKVDITRFWNWKDSDIDHIELDQSALNGNSLLANAQTKFVDAPTVGAQATSHIDANALANALIARAQPTFADVLSNTDLRDLMKTVDTNTANGRDNVIKSNADILKTTIQAAATAAGAAMGGGAGALGSAGKLLGDTDALKGALTSLGIGESEAGSIVKQLSNGSMNVGDLVKKVSQAKSQGNGGNGNGGNGNGGNGNGGNGNGGNGNGGNGNGGNGNSGNGNGGTGDGGTGNGGKDPEEDDGGSHQTGQGGNDDRDSGRQDGQRQEGERQDEGDVTSIIGNIKTMMGYVADGMTPVDAFNKWLHQFTNDDLDYIEEELDLIASYYCKSNGIDQDKLLAFLENDSEEA